ncbi:MAG: lamin tail domain-containing protein [Deltaproteobacteria bacterium]|nr:lamin tail domain-containing protein [Deltaproteobacteria bacterium]
MVVLLCALLLIASGIDPSSASSITHPIILEFLPNPEALMDQGEYVVIYNPTGQEIDISDFILTDLEGEFEIPGGTILYPGLKYHIRLPADGIQLSNSGDEVILLDNTLRMVDCVIYGSSEYEGEGWQGSMLGSASEERIFRRFYLDRDTDTAYEWLPLREYYRGQSDFMPSPRSFSGEVTVFVSPDCSLEILQKEIRSASVLRVNVYLFESQDIEREVIDLLNRGGIVYILIEGSPVGGISDSEVKILRHIIEKGGEVRFSNDSLYRLNHAKYALIDSDTIILGSENWNSGGYPPDGSIGNRGWGVVIRDGEIYHDMSSIFEHDWAQGIKVSPSDLPQGSKSDTDEPDDRIGYEVFEAKNINGEFTANMIIGPDNSLHYETIIETINSAEKTLYIEQAYIRKDWRNDENPYLQSAINAAMQGVEVKVLLDSMWYNTNEENDNDELCNYLNNLASQENLNLEARLVRRDGISKIHNKGVIVDGQRVLISSINWNKHSPTYNREVGIIIENPELAAYYTEVFLYDWNLGRTETKLSKTIINPLIVAVMILLTASMIYLIKQWMGKSGK